MLSTDQDHLPQDLVIKAVIDEDSLPSAAKAHLDACEFCRAEKDKQQMRLGRLGEMAARLAPRPSRDEHGARERPPRRGFLQGWGLRSMLALGVAAVMLLLIAKWPPPVGNAPAQMVDSHSRLMMDVARLVDDPLPSLYRDITELSGEESADDILDDIVPGLEDDHLAMQ